MSIIAFNSGSIVEGPFCDYLNVTVPQDVGDLVLRDLWGLFPQVGPFNDLGDGLVSFLDPLGLHPSGTFRSRLRGKVLVLSASGGALARFREAGLYGEYLSILGSYPHRVSMLHATADYAVDSPPSVVAEVKQLAQSGGLSLTRKRIDPSQCSYLLGNNNHGHETGTVYLGKRQNADVWAKIYDKQHERISRNFSDPGPIVRVEVAIQSGMGPTLRDAYDPVAAFFHFAGKSLCTPPAGVAAWSGQGEGYVLPPKQDRTGAERLSRMVEFSRDIGRILDLAVSEFGDAALEHVTRELRLRLSRSAA